MRLTLLLLLSSIAAWAEPPADVIDFFSSAASALANDDAAAFLDHFDRNLPEYAALRGEVEGLLAAYDVGSTIEVVSDEGDNQKRSLALDWLLITDEKAANHGGHATRRRIVTCQIERRGKHWKITKIGTEPLLLLLHSP
jgi:hypothetical protein